jgi:hypothetical protein
MDVPSLPPVVPNFDAIMAAMTSVARMRVELRRLSPLQLHHLRAAQPPIMHHACRHSPAGVVLLLHLEFEFSLAADHGDVGHPFHAACDANNLDVAELLLTYDDCKATTPTSGTRSTPLHIAARRGHVDVIALLTVHFPLLVDAKDAASRTALACAAENNHFGAARRLVNAGAKRLALTAELRAPWMAAVDNANTALLRLLVDFTPTRAYMSPLQYVVNSKTTDEASVRLAAILIELGDDVTVTTATGLTLHALASKREKKLTAVLFENSQQVSPPPF